MDSENQTITLAVRKLKERDPQAAAEVVSFRGETTIVVPRERLVGTAEFLKSDPELAFDFLSDITAVDRFPVEPRFEVNYHLTSLKNRARLRLKVKVTAKDAVIATVTTLWPTANWHEREIFDLMGVRFEGHPNLTRILMPDDWEGHPHRKDYPVEGYR
ncbi:MAG TPA: NADH-quinone oxidoreductase subunit C [Candidatus Acidoferrales bacterium]|nr:NADH-quinone oxidoreductase subunit C [Candidatus Acidoferrales bacterium]